ncbi:DUF262 domain-containing protein [Pseudomonas sp. CFBP 8770]|uniref:DUF262 domain-containing protein n=1 Tax=unclassified Pseudomonas TaxID=196821 RepID=UPI00177DB23E|nr:MULTISPECIES: DUF262 domain-containing protein [unclassified Pseudomonas]MBD8473081.1 DUF262 domain-containing protein [Pseudomonas sp. CFBP 8773]MBD8645816.1 DUF262 domain-containing protein [Pseudomonas sp. CFBP 8770]
MDNQLLTLSKIFTERLFRIPDYQRGYAWTEKQLKDFWSDIQQLGSASNHYTGVLTLESVPEETFNKWDDDRWIINAKSYQPYFVVDGQQRLTTAIVLIQSILETVATDDVLNFTAKLDIQRKFIFDSKDGGISRSYAFGYERDNPSYEFLKTKIFNEHSPSASEEETIYTQNLAAAKEFFQERLATLDKPAIENLYKKITQQLLFNIFTITEEVDVCVAFETMNNRGKPLSYLELLKNRLIYLSLKFDEPDYERGKLRHTINDCWKSIYHNLGRNKDQPLDDDQFLQTHYLLYFGHSFMEGFDPDDSPLTNIRHLNRISYSSDLLEIRFVARNVRPDAPADSRISLKNIYDYVNSLQEAVVLWYKMWNPEDSDFPPDVVLWLAKLNRFEGQDTRLLVLSFFRVESSSAKRIEFLQALERRLFLTLLISSRYGYAYFNRGIMQSLEQAVALQTHNITSEKLIKQLTDSTNSWIKSDGFIQNVFGGLRADGYYAWEGIRYFLFEYNLDMQANSKTNRPKIFWPEFKEHKKDFISVEHIYPRQARHSYWTSRFGSFNQKQKELIRNSLGNLLPLSRPKNSSLSNKPFMEKVNGKPDQHVGYRYGCYAENDVAKEQDWTPELILTRGIKMLKFMEKRWNLSLGDDNAKQKILGLDFVKLPPSTPKV